MPLTASSVLARGPEAAGAAVALGERLDDVELHLHHGDHDHLRDAFHGIHHERLAAAVPARDEDLPLVVRVDEPNEVAEHDAVLVPEARARDEDRGEPGIAEVDRDARGDEGTLPGAQSERS